MKYISYYYSDYYKDIKDGDHGSTPFGIANGYTTENYTEAELEKLCEEWETEDNVDENGNAILCTDKNYKYWTIKEM